jgi:hypothetical protein
MRRWWWSVVVFAAAAVLVPSSSYAQQTFGMHVGWFSPRGEHARAPGDVLFNDLFNDFYSLDFEVNDFRNVTFGADWLVGLGDYLEAGVGAGLYVKTVHSRYFHLFEDDGTEIEQDLRLRNIPLTGTLRFLPLGRRSAVEPYVGAGIGLFAWEYSEVGEFVDTFDDTVFLDRFAASGWAVGPVVLGGVRFPLGGGSLGMEVRYQNAEGDLPEDEFLGSVIDLSGFNYLATFNIRF